MTRATGYWHTGVTVRDAARFAAYLHEVLGLEIAEPVTLAEATAATVTGIDNAGIKATFARGPGVTIELLEYASSPDTAAMTPPDGIGGMHLAFMVDDLDAVLAAGAPWGRRLVGGIFTATTGPRTGWRICYTTDDDGILMEFAQAAP
ncbi:MAG TPA: VOC family protein [Rhizobiaceae bacterium]|nr:VOC family protein [Rhizobiaceae bacterium]